MEGKALRVAVLDAMDDHTPTAVRHLMLALVIALVIALVLVLVLV